MPRSYIYIHVSLLYEKCVKSIGIEGVVSQRMQIELPLTGL